jgi:hypothetical protein
VAVHEQVGIGKACHGDGGDHGGATIGLPAQHEQAQPTGGEHVADLLLIPSLASIPVAIAVAILRHRLFDIDVIIRRTVVYVVVMGMSGLVFAGSVLAVQSTARRLTGQDSALAVAASTLFAAALFNPLRTRVSRTVGRRFFRGDYDAETVVHRFAGIVRSETDIEVLTRDLALAVAETLHPSSVAVTVLGRRPAREPF